MIYFPAEEHKNLHSICYDGDEEEHAAIESPCV